MTDAVDFGKSGLVFTVRCRHSLPVVTAPRAQHDRLVRGWREHLAKIERQLFHGFLHQAVWTELRDEIQKRRPDADQTFLVSYSVGYGAAQMLLVRRLTDLDPNTDSLASLIQKIQRNPNVLTRTRYAEEWAAKVDEPLEHLTGESTWDSTFADPSCRERLNLTLLQADLDRLADLEHIVTWATKVVAHLDPQQPDRVPKYHELRDALDVLASVTGRYQSLLNQSVTGMWTPAIQGDWYAPFRPALFPVPPDVYWPDPRGYT
jgi:hypothetical protein